MNLDEFIDAVFLKYPPKISIYKPIEDWYGEYRLALTSEDEYDFQAAYNDFSKNYRYSQVPFPNTLRTYLQRHIKQHNQTVFEHIKEIKRTPKLDIENIDDALKQKVIAFCARYGAKTCLNTKTFKFEGNKNAT